MASESSFAADTSLRRGLAEDGASSLSLELGGAKRALDLDGVDSGEQKRRKPRDGARQGGTPDGRCCKFCGACDRDDDPVDLAVVFMKSPRSWGYPDRAGLQQGHACYYCMGVFQSRYKHRGKGLYSIK